MMLAELLETTGAADNVRLGQAGGAATELLADLDKSKFAVFEGNCAV